MVLINVECSICHRIDKIEDGGKPDNINPLIYLDIGMCIVKGQIMCSTHTTELKAITEEYSIDEAVEKLKELEQRIINLEKT